jgi:predicted enzyme related to lactoylglutathione lyase
MTDNFVWYELCTSDLNGAKAFYGKLFGWTATQFGGEGAPDYQILEMAGTGVGGLMPLPEGMPKPFWIGYVGVANADAAIAKAKAAGANVHREMDIPEVGKIGLLSDPQGCGYALIQGYSDRKSEAFDQAKPGHGNWHELYSPDPAAGFDYYAGQYGWTRGRTMPMGEMGDYQLFQADGVDIGGMMKAPEGVPPSWGYYFGVPDIDEAVDTINANGGTVMHGPVEVPGGAWIVQLTDPQGAYVAVVGPRK